MFRRSWKTAAFACAALAAGQAMWDPSAAHAAAGWEPTRPVEVVNPAGAGGASDQMARLIAAVVTKNQLMNDANRPQGPGGTKHRGDRRDMHTTYTGNERHSARGGTGRKNTATRKD